MPRIYNPTVGPSENKAEVPNPETKTTTAEQPRPKKSEKKESGDS